MKFYLQVHIHSSFSSWSSSDVFLAQVLEKPCLTLIPNKDILSEEEHEWDPKSSLEYNVLAACQKAVDRSIPYGNLKLGSLNLQLTGLEIYDDYTVLTTHDNTYKTYQKPFTTATKEQLQLRKDYWINHGFSEAAQNELVSLLTPIHEKNRQLIHELAEARGKFMAVYPVYNVDKFSGGFSIDLMLNSTVHDYIENSYSPTRKSYCVNGYLGNSSRTTAKDELVEQHLREVYGWSSEQIGIWLTSTDGRHFCDQFNTAENLVNWAFADYSGTEPVRKCLTDEAAQALLLRYQTKLDSFESSLDHEHIRNLQGYVHSGTQGGFTNKFWSVLHSLYSPTLSSHLTSSDRKKSQDVLLELILCEFLQLSPVKAAHWIASSASALPSHFLDDNYSWLVYPSWPTA
jgi:hypothetical protein